MAEILIYKAVSVGDLRIANVNTREEFANWFASEIARVVHCQVEGYYYNNMVHLKCENVQTVSDALERRGLTHRIR